MKLEKIGDKIKRIRKEKDLSQSNLHSNQSAVSQIEKGTIKMPTSSMLRIIAKNMDESFDELIENTNWRPVAESRTDAEYAISQTQIDVKIEDWGEIKTTRKYYNAYDKHGVARKYDPETGYRLITDCRECNSPIQRHDQRYCFVCGKEIFIDINNDIITWKTYLTDDGDLAEDEFGIHWSIVDRSIIQFDVNIIENLEKIEWKIGIHSRILHRYRELKSQIGNPAAKIFDIIHSMQQQADTGIFSNLVIKDNTDTNKYYTTKWTGEEGHIGLYKHNEKVDEKKISALVDIEYLQNFNPNEEHKMNKVFLPLWLDAMTQLSYSEGIIKELRRHKRRLESQQSIGEELEKEKSDKSKDEKKS